MTHRTKIQVEARALQKRLGCKYTEALAAVKSAHPERYSLPEGQCKSCNSPLPAHTTLCPIWQQAAERKRSI